MIQVNLDVLKIINQLTDLKSKQIPYATSRALNALATEIQTGERAEIHSAFIVRRAQYIDYSVKIPRFSDKDDPIIQVQIGIDPARDQLVKFEQGGTKAPSAGGANIAVPIEARASPYAIVPNALRPKALNLQSVASKSGKMRTMGAQRTFLITLPSGKQGIYQRVGPGPDGVRLLYWLTPTVPIRPQLHFVDTARRVIADRWPTLFRQWLVRALDTAH